jgi:hypothetical protein
VTCDEPRGDGEEKESYLVDISENAVEEKEMERI